MGLETRVESFYERLDEWPAMIASPKPYRRPGLRRDQETQSDVEADVRATKGKLRQFARLVRDHGYTAEDTCRLGWALNMMYETHSGEERIVGLPYQHHPLHMSYKALKRLRPDDTDILVDLVLHDTIEDTVAEKKGVARRRIQRRLGQDSLRRVERLTTQGWAQPVKDYVTGRIRHETGVGHDGAKAVADNLEYAAMVKSELRSSDQTLLAKAFDGGDNMFYLDELSGHESFRQRVSNKYLLLLPAILDGLTSVNAERLGVMPDGVASLRQRYANHVDEVKGYAERWEYHDEQLAAAALLGSDHELEGVEHDEYHPKRRVYTV